MWRKNSFSFSAWKRHTIECQICGKLKYNCSLGKVIITIYVEGEEEEKKKRDFLFLFLKIESFYI